ncbi:MAG: twin-arginine translocase subunit TatC [Deltaproteobacteria bacterium]|nr:twin-arginine translocase subunit TatC [Deltaproteobacteria bacterium]
MQKLSLAGHIEELRRRLFSSVIVFLVSFAISIYFRDVILKFVLFPHLKIMSKLNLPQRLYTFGYSENFMVQMKICAIVALVFCFPYILFQIFKFTSAGLYAPEKKVIWFTYLPLSIFLFLCGATLGYVLLIPTGLEFLAKFGFGDTIHPLMNLGTYVSLFFLLVFMTGAVFELPLFMMVLAHMGLLSSIHFRSFRSWAILLSFIVGGILTPPDPLTQLFLAVPFVILYEIGILLSRWVEPRLSENSHSEARRAEESRRLRR